MGLVSLYHLNNDELVLKIKDAVSIERKAITSVLHYLHEVEVRRLHLLRGFSSLWEFAVTELGYSSGGADRRIKAMRLIYAVPGTESKISDGSLSLTNASQLQNFFRTEKKEKGKIYTVEQKQELIESVQHQSTRECEKILIGLSPEHARKDKERILSNEEVEIRFTASQRLLDKLKKIKGLVSHKNPSPSYGELFEMLADLAIEKIDLSLKKKKRSVLMAEENSRPACDELRIVTPAPSSQQILQVRESASLITARKTKQSRYIPTVIRQAVWKKDLGQCSFIDSKTKRRCTSTYKLQIDHQLPYAMGGTAELSNLRLRCAGHNQLAAVQVFGEEKMARFCGAY